MSRTIDLDAVLSDWMAEGATQAPEWHTGRALEQIAFIPQATVRRPAAMDLRLLTAVAAALVLLVVSLGVAFRVGLIGPVGPSLPPAPAPSATADSGPAVDGPGPRIAEAPDGTFQVELPSTRWTIDRGPDPTALYLRHNAARISIRAGDADGRLLTCDDPAGPWEACESITATTLDDIAEGVGLTSASEAGIFPSGPTRTETTLDGEPAALEKIEAYEHPAGGAEFVTYVTAIHNGRPYLLRFWTPTAAGLNGDVGFVLEGFRFVDEPTPSLEPIIEPEAVDGFRTFVSPDGSFEIRLPEAWHLARGGDPMALYLRNQMNEISIRRGDADGRIQTCDRNASHGAWETCDSITAVSLDDLASGIGLADRGIVHQGPLRSSTTLGSESAVQIEIVGGPSAFSVAYVVAMHDGRPFIVRIGRPGGDLVPGDLIEGFEFLDP